MPYESRVLSILETPVNTLYRLNEPSKRHFPLVFHRFREYFSTHLATSCTSPSLLLQPCKAQGALCRPLRKRLPTRGGIPLASKRRMVSGSIGVVMVGMKFPASWN